MKKINYLILAICSMAFVALTSCEKDPQPKGSNVSIDAGIASITSRAAWNKTANKTSWEDGDEIGVFVETASNAKFTLGENGKFNAKMESTPANTANYYAYYPYCEDAHINSKTIIMPISATQAYSADGFLAAPMVATYSGPAEDAEMTFQHALAILKVSAKMEAGAETSTFNSMMLTGNGSEPMAGKVTINMSNVSGTLPATSPIVVEFIEETDNVTLDCGNAGVQVSSSARTDFYIAIPARTYESGISLMFKAGDAVTTVSYTDEIIASRGTITPIEVTLESPNSAKYDIPDPMFKKYLADNKFIRLDEEGNIIAVYNTEGMSIAISSAMDYPHIKSFKGIEYFTKCVALQLHYYLQDGHLSVLEDVDVSALTELKQIMLTGGHKKLTKLDVSKNTKLEQLWIGRSEITSLDLSNNPKLWMLSIEGGCPITTIDVSMLPDLQVINLRGCSDISSLNISNNPKLTGVTVADTAISALDISNNPELNLINISDTDISELDLSNTDALFSINASRSKIKRLDLKNKTALSEILLGGTSTLEYLDISGCNAISNIATTGKDGSIWSLMQASSTALDFSLMGASYYPNFKTFLFDNVTARNPILTDLIIEDTYFETVSIQNSTGISKLVVRNNPELGALYVGTLDLTSIDATIENNKTPDIVITSPRE